ncbi:MAG: hypothetical protein IK099_09275 [Clostridia bacterium]|nr:hypothetical protein [Clostridia bacterium]
MDKQIKDKERELAAREKAIREKEAELAQKEKALDPFSMAVKIKKESWYEKVKLSVRQMDAIIWVVSILLGIVVILIILEAAGIYKLPF